MIQRIQTVYLLLSLFSLIVLSTGTDVFVTKINEQQQFELISHANVYGVQKDIEIKGVIDDNNIQLLREETGKIDVQDGLQGVSTYSFPFYIFTILASLLTTAAIFSYKKLKKQRKLGFLLIFVNLIFFSIAIYLYSGMRGHVLSIFNENQVVVELGLGFHCISISFAFSILALLGIRRDLKIISSLDRLR